MDVNARDKFGQTALHHAAWNGRFSVVVLLLRTGAIVDGVDKRGRTALHRAAGNGRAPIAEMLLKTGAAVDTADESGKTLLHTACMIHQPETARLLLAANASLRTKDEDGLAPLHQLLTSRPLRRVGEKTLRTLQVLVTYGATWDTQCDELVAMGKAYDQAPALRPCMSFWAQEIADGVGLTDVPIENIRRGVASTQTYIESLKRSSQIVLRRKICLVGPSCAGKTSFVKSIITCKPQLEHLDNRTIGIDHFPLRFKEPATYKESPKLHEVTFWDFAGQDAYQVAHSLFFSPRTLFLVFVDLEAFTVAYLQASIMSNLKKQENHLMTEFIDRTVMQWIRMIVARQPDAEFEFVATKEDLLKENKVTERLLKRALEAKLEEVETITEDIRYKLNGTKDPVASVVSAVKVTTLSLTYVSCLSSESVQTAREEIEDLITSSNYSFVMPDAYTKALEAIVGMRVDAKSCDITTRIDRVFVPVKELPVKLNLEPEACRLILQTLHDLGDVLWYEDLGVELFQDRVILEPLVLIDFIRQVINHEGTGQVLPHADLRARPYWVGLQDEKQMEAMKQVLQRFHLVYSADVDQAMGWDSDLIVPAYWQTKTPASWLFLGDILRINDTKSRKGEALRVHWEYHFEFGLPSSLFDHMIVASISPYFSFDAGPDWILYEEKDVAACRIMVGRDPKMLHRTIHVEAVVAETASAKQAAQIWGTFEQIVGAFIRVMREYPGLLVSSFAWDDARQKPMLKRLAASQAAPEELSWMPPRKTWRWFQQLVADEEE